jgi:hypothetical protein
VSRLAHCLWKCKRMIKNLSVFEYSISHLNINIEIAGVIGLSKMCANCYKSRF